MSMKPMIALATLTLIGCGGAPANTVPQDLQGHFPSGHLMGTDPFNVTITANSIAVDGCDVNCGATGVITYALTTVTVDSDHVAHWTSADCTGTIERTGGSGGISMTATAVPGATGEDATNRSMRCALLDGGILTPG